RHRRGARVKRLILRPVRERGMRRRAVLGALLIGVVAVAASAAGIGARGAVASPPTGCQLNSPKGNIKHVIYIQFDNTHFRRDNPNVPSDLEQMPHLLNFIRGNGRLRSEEHTSELQSLAYL